MLADVSAINEASCITRFRKRGLENDRPRGTYSIHQPLVPQRSQIDQGDDSCFQVIALRFLDTAMSTYHSQQKAINV